LKNTNKQLFLAEPDLLLKSSLLKPIYIHLQHIFHELQNPFGCSLLSLLLCQCHEPQSSLRRPSLVHF